MDTVPTVRPPLSKHHSTSSLDRRDLTLQHGTLCATSTVGVAALGYSFGREAQPATPRPGSNKRKAGGETVFPESIQPPNTTTKFTSLEESLPSPPHKDSPTPGPSLQPVPNAQTAARQIAPYAAEQTPTGENEEHAQSNHQALGRHPSVRERPLSFEYKANGANRSSSWMKRLSTLSSSSRNESPSPSSRSGSPSMSFSNGSSAPILPHVNSSPAGLPPNKLVKRTSSQRALHGSGTMQPPSSRPQFPTLRRPATSHQRSATLRQQNPQDGESELSAPARQLSSTLPPSPIGRSVSHPRNMGHWQPHFRRKPKTLSGEGPPAKRHTAGGSYQNDAIRRITPDVDQLPTLLMATSISPKVSEEAVCHDRGNGPLIGSGSSTPSGIPSAFASSTDASDSDRRPRRSFSIGDMLSSRTPPSWKAAQSRSHRQKANRSNGSTGKRIASAPHTSELRRTTSSNQADTGHSAGRRVVTDPTIFHHTSEVGTIDSPALHSSGLHSAPVLPSPLYSPTAFEVDFRTGTTSHPSTSHSESPSTSSYVTSAPPSSPPVPILAMHRPQRYSVGPSDRASTLVGSDNDTRGFVDEEEVDFQSETVFDSLRTGATGSSNSGTRGPRIETIFDESPPPDMRKPKLVELQELLRDGSFSNTPANTDSRRRILEEEEGLSTPIRANASKQEDDDYPTPVKHQVDRLLHPVVPASPAEVPTSLSLGKLEWDDDDLGRSTGQWALDGEEGEDWDCDDGDVVSHDPTGGSTISPGHSFAAVRTHPAMTANHPLSSTDEAGERGTRGNIFDWSEQQYVEKDALQDSSPRPSTVHGKQGVESRGSRSTGRRGPHAVHLRSQSVPVTPDTSIHRDHGNSSSKLGPWGLGNKGVSEDWNDDFEFEEPNARAGQGDGVTDRESNSSAVPDFVPKAILERQASVHGQFGQVREFALMVEELKRLRAQASSLGIIEGPSVELWKEAEGIINLATQDDEDREYSPPHSPSSPRSNPDPFEEHSATNQNRRNTPKLPIKEQMTVQRNSHDLGSTTTRVEAFSRFTTPPPMRPRKESSAKAKSVLETIYQQRGNSDPLLTSMESRTQRKLPFDTTSLRDLVVRAGVVTRAVKEIVRKAENTPQAQIRQISPPPDPLFSQIFVQPDESPLSAKGRVSKNASSNGFRPGAISGNDNEINGHMKMMTVV